MYTLIAALIISSYTIKKRKQKDWIILFSFSASRLLVILSAVTTGFSQVSIPCRNLFSTNAKFMTRDIWVISPAARPA